MPYLKEKIEGDLREAFKFMAQERLSFEAELLLRHYQLKMGQLLIQKSQDKILEKEKFEVKNLEDRSVQKGEEKDLEKTGKQKIQHVFQKTEKLSPKGRKQKRKC